MKKLFTALIVLCGMSLVAVDVEARRLGGARNLGMQRNIQQAPAPKAPAQQQAQQQQQTSGTPSPTAANKWAGPLTGLALGAGLMALFMNNGIAGVLAGLLLMAGVAMLAFRALRGRTEHAPLQYAGNQLGSAAPFAAGTAAHSVAAAAGRWPAGFDAAGFLRHARRNFVRLQEAHDARDSTALADFLTPDLLQDVRAQWLEEGSPAGRTEVVTLESEVLDVVTEGLLHIVSVRFSGLIREDGSEQQSFAEIWHLEKPLRGDTGWLVSGIQQA